MKGNMTSGTCCLACTFLQSYDKELFDAKCSTSFDFMIHFASSRQKWQDSLSN